MAQAKGIVSIPATGGETGLNRYLAEIKKFPILSPEEEYMLAKRWREHGDTEAVAKLATDLGVSEDEVVSMNRRMAMGGDTSLNAPLKDSEGESQWQDFLVDS